MTNEPTETGAQWLTVAQAAQRLNVSPRAIQKRCASGKLPARRIVTPQGAKWEIDANELPRTDEQRTRTSELKPDEPANIGREPEDSQVQDDTNPRTELDEQDANERTIGREPANIITTRYVAHLEDEVQHLRGQIEAQRAEYLATIENDRRESALTIAALRDAIKAMPKALPESTQDAPQQAAIVETVPTSSASETEEPRPVEPPIRRGLWQRLKQWGAQHD